ncbi:MULTISPECIES: proline--tRNA ligase [Treponema]|uniref:Proline--tRNA ligase n=1 Tax=Treponema rectale TaxID=744512 RepID=A0A840SIA6_9SPIR|nr:MULTISPECIES: proline--tRNA ligase [Treponema]MBB5219243.1 prolyl-tRNA synthetase [Treponema rectale]MBE6354826.1 proline--tRNA ligase [Treponema sp.]QOS41269.1 proline--tRNA ligase [Treponema rectale]
MKTSQIPFRTLREAPAEAIIASHQLMMRADLIRKLGNGLYTYMPLGLKAYRKVEGIIKDELNKSGALEFKPTVIVPGEIWKESGRWETMGPQMLKAKNRGDQDMVVSPTAEEAYTAICRAGLTSYKQLPINMYQINTKYRDEIRPRYGVMRGREFNMMDGYTLNANDESLDESYQGYAKAYHRIFKRLGLKVIPVKADTGAMGGSGSEEFMVESPVGDDTLILCPKCGYAANVEKASCRPDPALDDSGKPQAKTDLPFEEVATPNVFSIEDMEKFFGTTSKRFVKALIYRVINSSLDLTGTAGADKLKRVKEGDFEFYPVSYVCVLIRGDLDVNEAKLAGLLKASEVCLADDEEVVAMSGAPHGFVGPVKLNCPIVQDLSVNDMHDAFAGAGKEGFHIKHVEPGRDFTAWKNADVRTVKSGDKCCCEGCDGEYYTTKGNELGHIFKLGKKYTQSMGVTYLDENGKAAVPTMGCYGIGVDRVLASIIESFHDDKGIQWPMSVAPFQVAIVPIKYKDAMKDAADKLYDELTAAGIEVLLDDRDERPGVKFNDMDLLGFPVRITVGDKNLPNVEVKIRNQAEASLVPLTEAGAKVADIVRSALAELNAV